MQTEKLIKFSEILIKKSKTFKYQTINLNHMCHMCSCSDPICVSNAALTPKVISVLVFMATCCVGMPMLKHNNNSITVCNTDIEHVSLALEYYILWTMSEKLDCAAFFHAGVSAGLKTQKGV